MTLADRLESMRRMLTAYVCQTFPKEDSSEVVQESIVRVLGTHANDADCFSGPDGDKRLYGYLRKTAVNFACDPRRKRMVTGDSDDVAARDRRSPGPSPFSELRIAESEQRLWDAIADLPDAEQTVLLCRDIENMKLDDIAERMDLSVHQVGRLYRKATETLRQRFTPSDFNSIARYGG